MLADIQKTFQQIDKCLETPNHLTINQKDTIKMVYGEEECLPVDPEEERPPSPGSSLARAGEYVLKLQNKGFVKLKDTPSSPRQVYKNTLIPMQIKRNAAKQQVIEVQKPVFTEEFQHFWQSLDIVKNICKELNSLPFKDPIDKAQTEAQFRDSVASVARILHNDGLTNEKKQNRKQLLNTMNFFVNKAKEIRHTQIRQYLEFNHLSYEDLPPYLKEEFPEYAPREKEVPVQLVKDTSTQKIDPRQDEINTKMLEHVANHYTNLPSEYRMGKYPLDEKGRRKDKREMKTNILTASTLMKKAMDKPRNMSSPIPKPPSKISFGNDRLPTTGTKLKRRPQVLSSQTYKRPTTAPMPPKPQQSPTMSDSDIYALFWESNDPLKNHREGEYVSTLSEIAKYSTDVPQIDYTSVAETDVNDPFELSQKPVVPPSEDTFSDTLPNTGNLSDEIVGIPIDRVFSTSVFSISPDQDVPERDETIKGIMANLHYDIDRSNTQDMKYLIMQSPEMLREIKNNTVYQRLEKIWEKLGFSINQKLDMVIKYSKDIEESGKLSEALDFWEQTNSVVDQYEHAYQMMKDFLRLEASTSKQRDITYQFLDADLKDAEAGLMSVGLRLKAQFGDDLVLHRRRVAELIPSRRLKLKMIAKEIGIFT